MEYPNPPDTVNVKSHAPVMEPSSL